MMPLRTLGTSLVLFFAIGIPQIFAKDSVTVTTFNVRMYGYRNDSEVRDPELKKFIFESIPASDIMVFEEIMDVTRFKKMLPENWSCLSYDHLTPHQFVLLCHSEKYNFKREPTDNNDVIDEVGGVKGTLRPAVTAIVTDLKGNALFRMVAVHLKALPDFTTVRVDQAKVIANWLSHVQNPSLPVIVTGDFNTYKAQMNGQNDNDVTLIQNKFDEAGLKLKHVPNELFTFRTNYGASQFDQFYVSSSLSVTKPLTVYEVCNSDTTSMGLEHYNQIISDHCPVTAEIEF